MKKIILNILMLALIATNSLTAVAQNATKTVKNSKLLWKGYKVTGSHEGTINLASGAVVMNGSKLKGGTFTIDMTSLESTDLDGEMKGKLDGHLKADDFFGVEKFPTAKLEIKKIKSTGNGTYMLTADLTIKGITQTIKFPATVKANKASAKLKIDRTKFNIKYGSSSFFENLQDKAISNEFDLAINFEF